MNHKKTVNGRRLSIAVVILSMAAMLLGAPAWAETQVTAVAGSAFGYHADEIALFGGAQPDTGPTPTVTLAPDASNSPTTATATTGLVQYGPAVLFTSDQIDVGTSGSLGTSGSVTSFTDIDNVNKATTQPTLTGSEIFTADNVVSTCTASGSGATGSTMITNGMLQTDSGFDANGDGDFDDADEHAPVVETIPTNPALNTSYTGHIHLSSTSVDDFTVVFNEQTVNPDGSITLTAVHEHFGTVPPDILVGHLYIGQAVCGVTVETTPNSPPVASDDSYSTDFETALTVPAPGVLANDTDPEGGPLTAGSIGNPSNGSVTLNSDGSFTYTPDPGFSGTDTFTYTVTDNMGATDTGLVTITVGAPPTMSTDLSVSVADSPDPVSTGGQATYTITVNNLSSQSVSDVTVLSTLSGARKILSAVSSGTGDTCVRLKGKTKGVSCNLGTLTGGASEVISVVVQAPQKAGSMSLTSTVSSAATDTDPANNTDTETTTIQEL